MNIKSHVRAGATVAHRTLNDSGKIVYYPPVGRCVGI
jgi:hypothetical protein